MRSSSSTFPMSASSLATGGDSAVDFLGIAVFIPSFFFFVVLPLPDFRAPTALGLMAAKPTRPGDRVGVCCDSTSASMLAFCVCHRDQQQSPEQQLSPCVAAAAQSSLVH